MGRDGVPRINQQTLADADLVRRCLEGNVQAWADIYLKYKTPLFALITSWTDDHALAEDVLHDAFVRAFQQMKSFDLRRPFFRWIASIAKNLLYDFHRKQRPSVSLSDDASPSTCKVDSTVEEVLSNEERDVLHRALHRLPRTQFNAIVLADVDELTYAQVAAVVGTSESAAKSLVFRARSMLRRSMRTLVAIIGLQRLRMRARDAGQRVAALPPALTGDVGYASAAIMLTAVLLFTPAITNFEGVKSPPFSAEQVAVSRMHTSSMKRTEIHPVRTEGQIAIPRAAAQWSPGPRRKRAVVPKDSYLRIQVYDREGQLFWESDTGYRCDGQGAELLPTDGPIRTVC